MDYEKKYKEALARARYYWETDNDNTLNIKAKGTMEYLFPELRESEDEKIRKEILEYITITADSKSNKMEWIAWLEKQKPSGYNNLAELTTDGPTEDMMSLRIEHMPLSVRTKNALRCQFKTIGDMVSYCEGKWRRLRGLRYIGKATYNEIMEYLGIDDRL